MASYVIHNIAGEELLKTLKNLNYNISLKDYNKFLMGNLIPDSSKLDKPSTEEDIQREKHTTHFRDKSDFNKTIQIPNIDKFLSKYNNLLSKDISVLGYLFHLYTDKVFFGDLFNKSFIFLDSNKKETNILSNTNTVILKKDNLEYDYNKIFSFNSNISIYSDYTKMNSLLLSKYHSIFSYNTLLKYINNFNNPGIEEVDYSNIENVLTKTNKFIEQSKLESNYTLNIFNQKDIENFITLIVESFISTYIKEINISLKTS